LPNKEKI